MGPIAADYHKLEMRRVFKLIDQYEKGNYEWEFVMFVIWRILGIGMKCESFTKKWNDRQGFKTSSTILIHNVFSPNKK